MCLISPASPFLRPPLLVLSLFSLPLSAADFQVTTETDQLSGSCAAQCSLRDAVEAANRLGGANRIILPAGTYTLTRLPPRGEDGEILDDDENQNGDLDVSSNLNLVGAGAGTSIIDGNRIDRLFEVLAGAELQLDRVTLRNGKTNFYGAGIENHGILTVSRSRLSDNFASGMFEPGAGGGIANFGQLNLYSSTLHRNNSSAGEAYQGRGGGIYNEGIAVVRDSTFSENGASDDDESGMGGGLYNKGNADVARSAFINNWSAGSGAAISNHAVLKLSNSTLSGNDNIYSYYGGIFSNGHAYSFYNGAPDATLVHVTIAGNFGGGLFNYGKLLLRNSLISGNSDREDAESTNNCANIGIEATYKARGLLLGNGPGNCTAELYVENDQTFVSVLDPLADNGGLTQTHALRAASPALDASIGNCSSHDQRRTPRPQDGNGDGIAVCDLGAYER